MFQCVRSYGLGVLSLPVMCWELHPQCTWGEKSKVSGEGHHCHQKGSWESLPPRLLFPHTKHSVLPLWKMQHTMVLPWKCGAGPYQKPNPAATLILNFAGPRGTQKTCVIHTLISSFCCHCTKWIKILYIATYLQSCCTQGLLNSFLMSK